ncbi:DUF6062 family protein [Dictyobacter arantiisoli]|uniref:Uncharacterized protein n=1 Tax=Dictyobacter arantiisoli TaxID=2014874 RepID=A0A5A5TBC4_9CHLR|nr:DUF6062 family protein [Dictyobacter arantiisoli]GCF08535.1 hypothetical protein KDI_20990 [Dictyobacter arantiisoli]
MVKTREYQALLSACSQEGCLLCNGALESVHRYLDAWKYELFTNIDIRQELRHTRGFCHEHTWQLVRMGATLPVAQAYRDILSDMIDQLQQNVQPSSSGNLLHRLFETRPIQHKQICPACKQKALAEERTIHTLRQALLDDEFYQRFSSTTGLCLEHFRLANELKTPEVPGDWTTRLRQVQLTCLKRLDAQLGELIRKHDYRFKEEERGPEMHSWIQAAGLVAGENTPD